MDPDLKRLADLDPSFDIPEPPKAASPPSCKVCGKAEGKMKKCSQCHKVHYCSVEC